MAIFYQPPEPRQAYPKVLPQTQGAQPKPTGPLGGSVNALTAVGVWATLALVPMPVQKPLNVVPLTLKYGSQPVPQAPLSATQQNAAVRSWDLPPQPPPPLIGVAAIKGVQAVAAYVAFSPINPAIVIWTQPNWPAQSGPVIAPLTLIYGDAPPGDLIRRVSRHLAGRAWDAPVIPFQQPLGTAAWNVPPVVSGIVLGGNQSPRWIIWPALDWPAQSENDNAGWNFTPPPVNQPTPVSAINPGALVSWLPLPWATQSAAANAAWNFIPPVVSQPTPYRVQPHIVHRQWEALFQYPQSLLGTANWNIPAAIPPFLPFTPQRHIVRYSWEPPFVYPASEADVAAFATAVAQVLTRAIEQADGQVALATGTSGLITVVQGSGIVLINSSDSKTIALISGNDAIVSLESSE